MHCNRLYPASSVWLLHLFRGKMQTAVQHTCQVDRALQYWRLCAVLGSWLRKARRAVDTKCMAPVSHRIKERTIQSWNGAV